MTVLLDDDPMRETIAVLSDSELVADIARVVSRPLTGDVLTADRIDALGRELRATG
ncbi:MAG: hypothetical protein ACFCVG_02935 [Kineosporiaceae bacterium]